MASTADFISTVYDELAKLLNITSAVPSMVMQMAWPGFLLGPPDFKRSDAPDGPYDPEVARETFSRLANIAPILNRTHYENSGYEVDDLYELLISSAIPAGATLATLQTNPLNKLFSDAQFELLQARRGVQDEPNAFYYPCTATPSNWYDDAAGQSWPTLNIRSTDMKPPSPTSPFVKAGGLALANQGVWKLRPTAAGSVAIKQRIEHGIATRVAPGLPTQPRIPKVTLIRPLTVHATQALGVLPDNLAAVAPARAEPMVPIDSVRTRTAVFRDRLSEARSRTLFTQKSLPASVFIQVNPGAQIAALDLTQKRVVLGRTDIVNRFVLQQLIDQHLPMKPPSTTQGFSISFRYCRVNIDRSWLKLALLSTRNWYMFGTTAGEYSTGSAENNPGMFPLLPVSFIAIRDLRITAEWTQEDRQNLANGAGFGFFDIRDGTLVANTLEVKGLQILGWISRLMPQVPPMSPP